jgi:hypothetical protein
MEEVKLLKVGKQNLVFYYVLSFSTKIRQSNKNLISLNSIFC